jgi:hypothetical protein
MIDKIEIIEYEDCYSIRIRDDFDHKDFGFQISKKRFRELYKVMTIEIVKKI